MVYMVFFPFLQATKNGGTIGNMQFMVDYYKAITGQVTLICGGNSRVLEETKCICTSSQGLLLWLMNGLIGFCFTQAAAGSLGAGV